MISLNPLENSGLKGNFARVMGKSMKKRNNRQKTAESHITTKMELDVLFHLPLWVLLERVSESHSVVLTSLQPNGLCSPWNPLGHSTGVG